LKYLVHFLAVRIPPHAVAGIEDVSPRGQTECRVDDY
jgi:hypothetical protein